MNMNSLKQTLKDLANGKIDIKEATKLLNPLPNPSNDGNKYNTYLVSIEKTFSIKDNVNPDDINIHQMLKDMIHNGDFDIKLISKGLTEEPDGFVDTKNAPKRRK